MRLWLAVLLIAGLPTLARAQDTSTSTPGVTVGGLPLPSIGLPLPSIGLPHPPTGLPPLNATPARPDPQPVPPPRRGRRGDGPPVVPVFMFPFFYVPPAPGVSGTSAGPPATSTRVDAVQNGRVWLEVEPGANAQLYVDGYYVGTPDDYREGLELPAGPHVIDVRAPGFETTSTSVQVPEGRTITYRASLTRRNIASDAADRPAPPASAAASSPSPSSDRGQAAAETPSRPTYYVIPGCYMGNVPPADAGLPPTCDPARAITIRP